MMDEAKRGLVQSWLNKARRDLDSARKLSTDPDQYLDTAIYHCQQAAEKSVKGFLVFHDQRFEKTHDIRALIEQAMTMDIGFSEWQEIGQRLTHYAVAFRYPSETIEPDQAEFEQAVKDAEDLYTFVLSLLPPEVHPQSKETPHDK
jgi:HEPN domain-containing protein